MIKWTSRNLRFLTSLISAAVMLLATAAVIVFINDRLPGGIGLAIALIAGISLALGVLVVYWNVVDWLNLRIIRRLLEPGNPILRDGEVVAFCGTVRQDGTPMTSPFGGVSCAAYTYVIATSVSSSHSGRRSRRVLAQGFHMNRSRIESTTRSVRLCSLPGFEDNLRQNLQGREWADKARALISKAAASASVASEKDLYVRLLEARHTIAEEFHQDFTRNADFGTGNALVIEEEVLPVDQIVCAVGTYDDRAKGLTAQKARLGPNLMIYQGTVEDVLARIGKDLIWFAKAAAILIGIGIVALGIALLPPGWVATLPGIG